MDSLVVLAHAAAHAQGHLLLAIIFNTVIGVSYLAVTCILVPGLKVPTESRRLDLALKACMVLFFVGCGSHHLHLAYRGVTTEPIVSQLTHHALLFNLMQVIGAPGAVILAYYIRLKVNRGAR